MRNFKLPSVLAAALLVMAASLITLARPRIAMPPEQGELDRFLGAWQLRMTVHPAVWTPQETTTESTYTSQWILGGRYVQQSSQDYLKLYTYNSTEDVYRYWFFDSSGIAVEARGDWNDETKSFVWLSSAGPGLTTTVTHHFLDDDTIDLTIIIRDSSGKVYYHSESQSTRTK